MNQLIIPSLIFFFILINCLLDIVMILEGEILSWSLMGVRGLTIMIYNDVLDIKVISKDMNILESKKNIFHHFVCNKKQIFLFQGERSSFFFSMTVARPAPSDAPLVSTPLIGKAIPRKYLFYNCSSEYRDVCILIG